MAQTRIAARRETRISSSPCFYRSGRKGYSKAGLGEMAVSRERSAMPRKLKTFVTESGFFELAVAAPSMKAALEDWGITVNLFQQGLARQTDDPAIVAAAQSAPGRVLR